MKFNLDDGTLVELQYLEQHLTYAGVLCGRFSAADHDRRIAEFVSDVRERLPWLGEIRVIPPVRTPLPYQADSSAPVAERLPRVTVLADFISTEPANDSSEMFSSAAIVWFQEEFGLPGERAIREMRKVDWKAIARDWSW